MQKVPTLFVRDAHTHTITPRVDPRCTWVISGPCAAYAKWDGQAINIEQGVPYKRYTLRVGRRAPAGFIAADFPQNGSVVGWVPAPETDPANACLWEALGRHFPWPRDGSYELCGPKICASRAPRGKGRKPNPHGFTGHVLIRHTSRLLLNVPTSFDGLGTMFSQGLVASGRPVFPYEGVVWHSPDGRMAKIKRADFGLPWGEEFALVGGRAC